MLLKHLLFVVVVISVAVSIPAPFGSGCSCTDLDYCVKGSTCFCSDPEGNCLLNEPGTCDCGDACPCDGAHVYNTQCQEQVVFQATSDVPSMLKLFQGYLASSSTESWTSFNVTKDSLYAESTSLITPEPSVNTFYAKFISCNNGPFDRCYLNITFSMLSPNVVCGYRWEEGSAICEFKNFLTKSIFSSVSYTLNPTLDLGGCWDS
eukprot:TRINITY_DN107_c1_g1_i1.p1 TRINITY_DN107_c1_g1~~TRINITY_DN107_c1_g1_i1.p1  ORF type:complete len:206 (-),score=30.26 TRINITY_DN107_c1_g1_i1:118-735(-)